jgi:hypothetical protein
VDVDAVGAVFPIDVLPGQHRRRRQIEHRYVELRIGVSQSAADRAVAAADIKQPPGALHRV